MNILVACEFSGIVRDAFIKAGHKAISCDLLPTENPGPHVEGGVLRFLAGKYCTKFDMMIAFPPCTYLCVSGNRWLVNNPKRWRQRYDALIFVHALMNANIPKICIENPVGVISTHIRKPDQYIHPYQFGHDVSKKTGLWLKGLPLLQSSNIVEPKFVIKGGKKYSGPALLGTVKDRGKIRSQTYQGVADAMAKQWDKLIIDGELNDK